MVLSGHAMKEVIIEDRLIEALKMSGKMLNVKIGILHSKC